MKSNPTLLRWYKSINKRFFDGGCPERVCVRWADVNEEGEKQWEENYFGWAGKVDTPYHDYEIYATITDPRSSCGDNLYQTEVFTKNPLSIKV